MKKALMLASVASMIDQFNIPNIKILLSLGYSVDVVADYTNPGNISKERSEDLIKRLKEMGANPIDIPIPRSINPKVVLRAYKPVKKLINTEHYNLIHCHSPIGGAITRIAAKSERKNGCKVIYTAHGFHFYKGAPLKNWLIFYPIEKILSKYTDILITINKEDYERATKKFKAKQTVYVPGIGVDTDKFEQKTNRIDNNIYKNFRKELGIPFDAKVLLSIGELSVRKNHQVVIKALNEINNSNVYYVIVGKGKLFEELKEIDNTGRLVLLGYRTDIPDILHATDLFVFPSIQEGLPVALMEAMASGLPCICSRIRGNTDLIEKEDFLFSFNSVEECKEKIIKLFNIQENNDIIGKRNIQIMKNFSIKTVQEQMKSLYNM